MIEEVSKVFFKGSAINKAYMSYRKWDGKSHNPFLSNKLACRVDTVAAYKGAKLKSRFLKDHKDAVWILGWVLLKEGHVAVTYLRNKGGLT